MKKITLLLMLTLLAGSSFGQKTRFSDSTNVWHGFDYSCGGDPNFVEPYTNSYTGDTTIHGLAYRVMGPNVFVREDTVLKKVFAIVSEFPDYDTAEQVVYNYTLNIGDTFKCSHAVHHVSSMDSVMVNSVWHKVWHLQGDSIDPAVHMMTTDYDVIEGIGTTTAPLYSLYPYFFETCITLTCFNNQGTTPPLSHKVGPYFDNGSSCELTFGLGVKSIAGKNNVATVVPNPIDKTGKIVFTDPISSGTLTIINNVGQTIVNTAFQNQQELLIGNSVTVPGIYFYRVTDNVSGKVFSGKFEY